MWISCVPFVLKCITFRVHSSAAMRRLNKNKLVCFRLDAETKDKLQRASARTGTSVSDLIRLCLKAELSNLSKRYGN